MTRYGGWFVRALLILLVVALLFAVPAALGQANVSSDVRLSGAFEGAQVPDAEVGDPESLGVATDAEVPDLVEQVQGQAAPVFGLAEEVRGGALPVLSPEAEGATEGHLGILSNGGSVLPSDVATASAALVAATGSVGLLFWLKNAIGLGLGRFLGAPLFSRLSKDDLLENDGRGTLFTLVQSTPGIGLMELAEQSGLGWGTTVYHLGRLEQAGLITSMKNGQARHFFQNGHPAAKNKKAIAVLKNDTAAHLARYLLATPGSTQSGIAEGMKVAPPTVTKYVKRLEAEGLVEVLKDGRTKIVQPTTALVEAMAHVDTVAPTYVAPEVMARSTPLEQGVSAYA